MVDIQVVSVLGFIVSINDHSHYSKRKVQKISFIIMTTILHMQLQRTTPKSYYWLALPCLLFGTGERLLLFHLKKNKFDSLLRSRWHYETEAIQDSVQLLTVESLMNRRKPCTWCINSLQNPCFREKNILAFLYLLEMCYIKNIW